MKIRVFEKIPRHFVNWIRNGADYCSSFFPLAVNDEKIRHDFLKFPMQQLRNCGRGDKRSHSMISARLKTREGVWKSLFAFYCKCIF